MRIPDAFPELLLWVILFSGLALALTKQHLAIYLALVLYSGVDQTRAVFTRTALLGPYFNLYDAVTLILLFATLALAFKQRKSLVFPGPVVTVILTLIMGLIVILMQSVFSYSLISALRSSLNFPLGYWIVANLVTFDRKFIKGILLSLLLGTTIATLQHYIVIIAGQSGYRIALSADGTLRTVRYLSLAPYFILAMPYLQVEKLLPSRYFSLYWVAWLLFIGSVLLSQTRSILIALVLAFLCLSFYYRKLNIRVLLLPIIALAFSGILQLVTNYNLINIILERFSYLATGGIDDNFGSGRALVVRLEWQLWLDGNLLWGRGTNFNSLETIQRITTDVYGFVGWGHIGHLNYLVTYGLIGFAVYSIYIPVSALLNGIRGQLFQTDPYLKAAISLSIAALFFDWFISFMSGSYLSPISMASGLLLGMGWAVAHYHAARQVTFRLIKTRARIQISQPKTQSVTQLRRNYT